jgi:hypothetical protein
MNKNILKIIPKMNEINKELNINLQYESLKIE